MVLCGVQTITYFMKDNFFLKIWFNVCYFFFFLNLEKVKACNTINAHDFQHNRIDIYIHVSINMIHINTNFLKLCSQDKMHLDTLLIKVKNLLIQNYSNKRQILNFSNKLFNKFCINVWCGWHSRYRK